MFIRVRFRCLSATLLAACLSPAMAAAQIPANPVARVNQEGKIVNMAGGAIQVLTADRQGWMLQITKDTSVMLTGKADATFLAPGAFVKFQAEINRRQKAVRPVDAFQVFTPTKQDLPGAFPTQGLGLPSDTASNRHGEPGQPGTKKPGPAAKPADRGGQKPHQADQEPAADEAGELYDIVGRITGARQGVLTVNYGKGAVEVEMAKDARVDLALTDLRFARPGDRIFFDGIVVGNEASRMLRAVTLQITRASPDDEKDQPEPGRQPGEPGRHAGDAPTHASPEKKAAQRLTPEQAKAVETFVEMLALKREPTNPEEFRIEGDPTEFEPCSRHSVKVLERRFGKPEQTEVEGVLTMRGREKASKWSMLRWGPVKVIVDRSHKTRFYALEK